MIDVESETILPLGDPTTYKHPLLRQGRNRGRSFCRGTLDRWRLRGVRAADGSVVLLETVMLGPGTRATSVEALRRFFARLNGTVPGSRTPAQARRDHAREDQYLQKVGV